MNKPREEGAYIARHFKGQIALVNVYYDDVDHRIGSSKMFAWSMGSPAPTLLDSEQWEDWTWNKIPTYREMDKLNEIINSFVTIMRLVIHESNKEANFKVDKG